MNIARIRPDTKARHRYRPRPLIRAALVLSVVDTCTGTLHRVPIESVALHRRSGRYPALCGIEVPAAGLTTPAANHCQDCAARTQPADAASHRKSRHPLIRWLRSLRPAHRNGAR
ncbi:MAG: hypothetical protein ACRDTG_08460 [Pseudonocardiaceae bacterium]